jgi:hypothetical protein
MPPVRSVIAQGLDPWLDPRFGGLVDANDVAISQKTRRPAGRAGRSASARMWWRRATNGSPVSSSCGPSTGALRCDGVVQLVRVVPTTSRSLRRSGPSGPKVATRTWPPGLTARRTVATYRRRSAWSRRWSRRWEIAAPRSRRARPASSRKGARFVDLDLHGARPAHERNAALSRRWLHSPAAVASDLTARGLSLERYESDGGRVTIAARRRPTSE